MKKICKNCNHFDKCVRVYNLYSCCIDYEAKPLTEQEYLQTCNTEQLAKVLCDVWYGIDDVINIMAEDGDISKIDAVKMWLKQPHTFK